MRKIENAIPMYALKVIFCIFFRQENSKKSHVFIFKGVKNELFIKNFIKKEEIEKFCRIYYIK